MKRWDPENREWVITEEGALAAYYGEDDLDDVPGNLAGLLAERRRAAEVPIEMMDLANRNRLINARRLQARTRNPAIIPVREAPVQTFQAKTRVPSRLMSTLFAKADSGLPPAALGQIQTALNNSGNALVASTPGIARQIAAHLPDVVGGIAWRHLSPLAQANLINRAIASFAHGAPPQAQPLKNSANYAPAYQPREAIMGRPKPPGLGQAMIQGLVVQGTKQALNVLAEQRDRQLQDARAKLSDPSKRHSAERLIQSNYLRSFSTLNEPSFIAFAQGQISGGLSPDQAMRSVRAGIVKALQLKLKDPQITLPGFELRTGAGAVNRGLRMAGGYDGDNNVAHSSPHPYYQERAARESANRRTRLWDVPEHPFGPGLSNIAPFSLSATGQRNMAANYRQTPITRQAAVAPSFFSNPIAALNRDVQQWTTVLNDPRATVDQKENAKVQIAQGLADLKVEQGRNNSGRPAMSPLVAQQIQSDLRKRLQTEREHLQDALRLSAGEDVWTVAATSANERTRKTTLALGLAPTLTGAGSSVAERGLYLDEAKQVDQRRRGIAATLRGRVAKTEFPDVPGNTAVSEIFVPQPDKNKTIQHLGLRVFAARKAFKHGGYSRERAGQPGFAEELAYMLSWIGNMKPFQAPAEGRKPSGGAGINKPTEIQAQRAADDRFAKQQARPDARAKIDAHLLAQERFSFIDSIAGEIDPQRRLNPNWSNELQSHEQARLDLHMLQFRRDNNIGYDVNPIFMKEEQLQVFQDFAGRVDAMDRVEQGGMDLPDNEFGAMTHFPSGQSTPGTRGESEWDQSRHYTEGQLQFALKRNQTHQAQLDQGHLSSDGLRTLWSIPRLGDYAGEHDRIGTTGVFNYGLGRKDESGFFGKLRKLDLSKIHPKNRRNVETIIAQDLNGFRSDGGHYQLGMRDIQALERHASEMEGDENAPRPGMELALQQTKIGGRVTARALSGGDEKIYTAPATSPEEIGQMYLTVGAKHRRMASSVQGYVGERHAALLPSMTRVGGFDSPFNLVLAQLLPHLDNPLLNQTARAKLKGSSLLHKTQMATRDTVFDPFELLTMFRQRNGPMPSELPDDPHLGQTLFMQAFDTDLDELVRSYGDYDDPAGMTWDDPKRGKKFNDQKRLIASSIAGPNGLFAKQFGGALDPKHLYASSSKIGDALWPGEEVAPQGRLAQLGHRLRKHLFARTLGDARPEYNRLVEEIQGDYHLGANEPAGYGDLNNVRDRLKRISDVFEGVQRLLANAGEGMNGAQDTGGFLNVSAMGLHLDEGLIQRGEDPGNQDLLQILRDESAKTRKQRGGHVHQSMREAVPGLHHYLGGAEGSEAERLQRLRDARGVHAPPLAQSKDLAVERQLKMSAVLNAAFEAIASQSDDFHVFADKKGQSELTKQLHHGTLASFGISLSRWGSLNAERDQTPGNPELLSMVHGMIAGQKADKQGLGFGLGGLETVEQLRAFWDNYQDLEREYDASNGVLSLSADALAQHALVMNYDQSHRYFSTDDYGSNPAFLDPEAPNSVPNLLKRLKSRADGKGMLAPKTPITYDKMGERRLRGSHEQARGNGLVPYTVAGLKAMKERFFDLDSGAMRDLLLDPAAAKELQITDQIRNLRATTFTPEEAPALSGLKAKLKARRQPGRTPPRAPYAKKWAEKIKRYEGREEDFFRDLSLKGYSQAQIDAIEREIQAAAPPEEKLASFPEGSNNWMLAKSVPGQITPDLALFGLPGLVEKAGGRLKQWWHDQQKLGITPGPKGRTVYLTREEMERQARLVAQTHPHLKTDLAAYVAMYPGAVTQEDMAADLAEMMGRDHLTPSQERFASQFPAGTPSQWNRDLMASVEEAHGALAHHTIESVFGGWREITSVPGYAAFEQANRDRILHPGDTLHQIPMGMIRATQAGFAHGVLDEYLANGIERPSPSGGGGAPMGYFHEGEVHLLDGHHRTAAAKLGGAETMGLHLVNPEAYEAHGAGSRFQPVAQASGAIYGPPAPAGGHAGASEAIPPRTVDFTPDAPELMPERDQRLIDLQRAIRGRYIFDDDPSFQNAASSAPYAGAHFDPKRDLSREQRAFLGQSGTPGGTPRIVVGDPGTGKTEAADIMSVVKAKREGKRGASLPVLLSFTRRAREVSIKRLKDNLGDQYGEYDKSHGISTVHSFGHHLMTTFGMGNVLGLRGGKQGYKHTYDPDQLLNEFSPFLSDPAGGDFSLKEQIGFTAYEQAGFSQQIETFRRAVAELGQDPRFAADYKDYLPYMAEHFGDEAKSLRSGEGDRDRPAHLIREEMKSQSGDTSEKALWDLVNQMTTGGMSAEQMLPVLDPKHGHALSDPKEYVAARILKQMDLISARGTLGYATNEQGESVPAFIRHYMPWDLINKPREYMEANPGSRAMIEHFQDRDIIMSEAQDANLSHWGLIEAVTGHKGEHMLGSGDPKQAIFGFQGGTETHLRQASNLAAKHGTLHQFTEGYRFTGGQTGYIDALHKALQFEDAAGKSQPLLPEPTLRAVGPNAGHLDAVPTATRLLAPRGVGHKEWTRRVIASQIAQMTGQGAIDPATEGELGRIGASGGHHVNDNIIVVPTNEDVAQFYRTLEQQGVPVLAHFAEEKVNDWTELRELAKRFHITDEQLSASITEANPARHENVRAFIDHAIGRKDEPGGFHGEVQTGRYATTIGAPYGAGALNLLKDLQEFSARLQMKKSGGRDAAGELLDGVTITTNHAMKGGEGKFAFVPFMSKEDRHITHETPAGARESLAQWYTPITRGSKTFMYYADEEGKKAKTGVSGFTLAEEFERTGQMTPVIVNQGEPVRAAGGGGFGGRRTQAQIARPAAAELTGKRSYDDFIKRMGKVFGHGSFDLEHDLRPGEHALIGEQGPEFFVRDGKFYQTEGPALIKDARKGDMVIPMEKAVAAGVKLQHRIVAGHGAPAAAGGSSFDEAFANAKSAFAQRVAERGVELDRVKGLSAAVALGTGRIPGRSPSTYHEDYHGSGFDIQRERGMVAQFADKEHAERYRDLMEGMGGRSDLTSGKTGHVVATHGAGPDQWRVLTAAADFARESGFGDKMMALDPKHAGVKKLGDDKALLKPLMGEGKEMAYDRAHDDIDITTKNISQMKEISTTLKATLGHMDVYVDKFRDALGAGAAKRGTGEVVVPGKPGYSEQLYANIDTEMGRRAGAAKAVPNRTDAKGYTTGVFDPTRGAEGQYVSPPVGSPGASFQPGQGGGAPPPRPPKKRSLPQKLFGNEDGQIQKYYVFGAYQREFEQIAQHGKDSQTLAQQFMGGALAAGAMSGAQIPLGTDGFADKANAQAKAVRGVIRSDFALDPAAGWAVHNGGDRFRGLMRNLGVDDNQLAAGYAMTAGIKGASTPMGIGAMGQLSAWGLMHGIDQRTAVTTPIAIAQGAGAPDLFLGARTAAGVAQSVASHTVLSQQEILGVVQAAVPTVMATLNLGAMGGYSAADVKMGYAGSLAQTLAGGGLNAGQVNSSMQSLAQAAFDPSMRQSVMIAQGLGQIDRNLNFRPGQSSMDANVIGQVMTQRQSLQEIGTAKNALAQETIGLTFGGAANSYQMGRATLTGEFAISAKTLDVQAESVQLNLKQNQEQAQAQTAATQAQHEASIVAFQAQSRHADFMASPEMTQLRGQQFAQEQEVQRNDLARQQASITLNRSYEDQLYGKPGADQSYLGYLKASGNQTRAGQSMTLQELGSATIGTQSGVGLNAQETYRGIEHQRAMLAYGTSSLFQGAAYEENMKYLDFQTDLAGKKIGLEGQNRQGNRDLQDASLADQAESLVINQKLALEMYKEQERQIQENKASTDAQGVALAKNIALDDLNLAHMRERNDLMAKEVSNTLDSINLQKTLLPLQQEQAQAMHDLHEALIPLMEMLYSAGINDLNGGGKYKGVQGANANGQIDVPTLIDVITKGALARVQDDIKGGLSEGDAQQLEAQKMAAQYGDQSMIAPFLQFLKNPDQKDALMQTLQAGAAGANINTEQANAAATQSYADPNKVLVTTMNDQITAGVNMIEAFKNANDAVTMFGNKVRSVGDQYGVSGVAGMGAGLMGALGETYMGGVAIKGLFGMARGALTGGMAGRVGGRVAGLFGRGGASGIVQNPAIMEEGFMGGAAMGGAMLGAPLVGMGIDKILGHYGHDDHGAFGAIGTGAMMGGMIGGPWGMAIGAGAGALYAGYQNREAIGTFMSDHGMGKEDFKEGLSKIKDAGVWLKDSAAPAMLEGVKNLGAAAFDFWKHPQEKLKEMLPENMAVVADLVGGTIQFMTNPIGFFLDHKDGAITAAADMYNSVVGFLGSVRDFVAGLPGQIIGAAGDMAGIGASLGKSVLNHLIVNPINGVLSMISGIGFDIHGVGVHMPDLGQIPQFRGGSDHLPGGVAVVGEDGPELLITQKGDKIVSTTRASMLEARQQYVDGMVNTPQAIATARPADDQLITPKADSSMTSTDSGSSYGQSYGGNTDNSGLIAAMTSLEAAIWQLDRDIVGAKPIDPLTEQPVAQSPLHLIGDPARPYDRHHPPAPGAAANVGDGTGMGTSGVAPGYSSALPGDGTGMVNSAKTSFDVTKEAFQKVIDASRDYMIVFDEMGKTAQLGVQDIEIGGKKFRETLQDGKWVVEVSDGIKQDVKKVATGFGAYLDPNGEWQAIPSQEIQDSLKSAGINFVAYLDPNGDWVIDAANRAKPALGDAGQNFHDQIDAYGPWVADAADLVKNGIKSAGAVYVDYLANLAAHGQTPQGQNFHDQGLAAGTSFFGGGRTWVGESGPELIKLPQFAHGGFYPGGVGLVGERGPELVHLPKGAQVLNAPRTAAVLGAITAQNIAGGGKGHTISVEVNLNNVGAVNEMTLEKIRSTVYQAVAEVLSD